MGFPCTKRGLAFETGNPLYSHASPTGCTAGNPGDQVKGPPAVQICWPAMNRCGSSSVSEMRASLVSLTAVIWSVWSCTKSDDAAPGKVWLKGHTWPISASWAARLFSTPEGSFASIVMAPIEEVPFSSSGVCDWPPGMIIASSNVPGVARLITALGLMAAIHAHAAAASIGQTWYSHGRFTEANE